MVNPGFSSLGEYLRVYLSLNLFFAKQRTQGNGFKGDPFLLDVIVRNIAILKNKEEVG